MDFHFKINNNNNVDCSSKGILSQILLKICESDAVAAIGGFQFWLDKIELRSPGTRGCYDIHDEEMLKKYELKTDLDAKNDKLVGLYIEREEEARKWMKNPVLGPSNTEIKAAYYVDPGLTGIRKCVNYIESFDKEKRENLPSYLSDLDLQYFEFTIGVIWSMDIERGMMEDGVFQFLDYDQDYISGSCDRSSCWFNYGNTLEGDFYIYNKPYYVNRLNKIQKILDDISPGRYEPRGEGEYNNLLKHGMLNRKGREYYSIDAKSYEEALHSYLQEIREEARKYNDKIVDKFEKNIAEHEILKNSITDLIVTEDKPKKSGENEENGD
jgi:hypothetical protein